MNSEFIYRCELKMYLRYVIDLKVGPCKISPEKDPNNAVWSQIFLRHII